MGEIDYDHVIRQFENGTLLRCSFCQGKAVWPTTDMEDGSEQPSVCPVCKGKSVVLFRTDRFNLTTCAMCKNTGKKIEEQGYFLGGTCEVCSGTGYVDISEAAFEVESTERHFWSLIDKRIISVSQDKFTSGFLADAVESAFKEITFLLKKRVKQITQEEYDGKNLAEHAFAISNPILIVETLDTESGRNIQIGYMMTFSGAIMGIRNPKAHENIKISKEEAINHIFVANYLINKLDGCKPNMEYKKCLKKEREQKVQAGMPRD